MNAKAIRNKLLGMFPLEHQSKLQPIVDSLAKQAHAEGTLAGREEAAAMIEVLVLGDGNLNQQTLRDLITTLRNA